MAAKLTNNEFRNANISPGPGRYNQYKTESIPSMKFGTGTRSAIALEKESLMKPGPG